MRVLIVDDEPLARDTLRLVLESDREVEVVGACSGLEAPALVARTAPELMFLDVEMPGADGFEVIAAIGVDTVPAIVFVTAYDRHAIRAFEVHALDYVLKPFSDRRIAQAVARAKQQRPAGGGRAGLAALVAQRVRRFCVRERGRVVFVEADAVDWFGAADDYVELHVGAVTHMVRERLADLEQRLDPTRFVRIHRGAIVNLAGIRELHPLIRGDAHLVLATGARLRVSRSRRAELERRIADSPPRADGSPQAR